MHETWERIDHALHEEENRAARLADEADQRNDFSGRMAHLTEACAFAHARYLVSKVLDDDPVAHGLRMGPVR